MANSCIDPLDGFPDHVRSCLKEIHRGTPPAYRPNLRQAAVLMPLFVDEGEWKVLFTRRSDVVQDHKGQVSFPGGAADASDESPEDTARREMYEEVGIRPEAVDLLGRMNDMPTITSYLITPVVGVISWPVKLEANPGEVARVFSIPLCWLADETHHEERLYRLPDGSEHPVIYFSEFDGELLWGVTARIVLEFLALTGLPHK